MESKILYFAEKNRSKITGTCRIFRAAQDEHGLHNCEYFDQFNSKWVADPEAASFLLNSAKADLLENDWALELIDLIRGTNRT